MEKLKSAKYSAAPAVMGARKGTSYHIVSIVRPNPKSVFGIYDPIGLPYLIKLRTGLSKLNYHKFKYNFKETVNPMCPSNDGIDDVEYLLLHCSSFLSLHRNLLARSFALIRPFGFANLF